MNKLITILIVNYNSSEFVDLSLFCLNKLTQNDYRVHILDNNSKIDDYLRLKEYVKKYDNVLLERSETDLRGSHAHGEALNYLVEKVDTPYFSILDADATWLKKGWDDILISQMSDKVKVIGTQAPGLKPQDFPLMFAILFETETFKCLNIDFRPKNFKLLQDTGWELRGKYLGAGYSGLNIEHRTTRLYKAGPFRKVICAEYYFMNNYDNIFASHFGRGSSMGANKYVKKWYEKIFFRLPVIGRMSLAFVGKKEKMKWIKICRKIVNKQDK